MLYDPALRKLIKAWRKPNITFFEPLEPDWSNDQGEIEKKEEGDTVSRPIQENSPDDDSI